MTDTPKDREVSGKIVRLDGKPFSGPQSAEQFETIQTYLRRLADAIDDGEYGGCPCLYVVMPQGEDYPAVFGWGDITGRNEPLVQLHLAHAWFISQAFGSSGWRV